MAGTTYIVAIDLQTRGNLGIEKYTTGLKAASGVVSKLQTGFSQMSGGVSKLFGMFDGIVSRVAGVGFGLAKWGTIGAAGVLTYGVVSLNNELEQTRIALGSIFQANGVAADLPAGMRLASDTIAKMRVDAQKLPGEFEDLRNIFTTVAIPGFQAGASVDQLRDMSGKLMAFAKVAQIPMEQAARESAMLLEGRAGAHNVLGMKLAALSGDQAKAFNQEGATKRFADVNKYLDKYKDSIDEFGKSWEGISSTTIDMGKQWLTLAAAPVFDKAKASLSKINDWFNENRDLVNSWAMYVGQKLGDAYDYALVKIEEWWPAIKQFAENAYAKLVSIWDEIQPAVTRFGDALQGALKDPGTLDKLIHIAELWGAGKVAGAALGVAGSVAQVGIGGAMVAKSMGWIGGGAAAAGGGVAAGGAAAAGGGAAGVAGGGLEMVGALALVAAPVVAALTALGLAVYATDDIMGQFSAFWKQDNDARTVAADKILNGSNMMSERFNSLNDATAQYEATQNTAMLAALDAASAMSAIGAALSTYALPRNQDIGDKAVSDITAMATQAARDYLHPTTSSGRPKPQQHPGGGGGTMIAKVEITVAGNNEPNRVAAIVFDKLNNLSRHRRSSPDVPSFSRGG